MDNIPLVPEKKQTAEPKVQEPQPPPSESLISINDTQKLVNEATYKVTNELAPKIAEEAASKAVSSYIQSIKPEPVTEGGLHVQDKTGAVLSYKQVKDLERETEERIKREYGIGAGGRNTVSLGARFEDALNQRLNDEVIGGLVGNMFRGGLPSEPKPTPGIVGGLLHELKGILDTKFGYGLGEKIGDKSTEFIKIFGTERIGAMMDAASGKTVQGQQQIEQAPPTPEEQQKALENALMSLDTTNIADMTKFMEANKLKNLDEARNILLSLQDKILQSRGLVRTSNGQAQSEDSTSRETPKARSRNKSGDINRDLIDQYDNPDQFNSRNQPNNFSSPRTDFFGNGGGGGNQPDLGFQQSQEEIILSLNPDEPSALHTYSAMRNISGVDATTIKKMLMKEQKSLLDKSSNPVQEVNQQNNSPLPVQDAQVVEHRGISPDEDQSRLRSTVLPNEFLGETPSKQEHIHQQSQQPINNTGINPPNSLQEEIENPMSTIMRVLDKLDKKIDYLESEITTLKSSNTIKADDFTDISSSEEHILKTKTVDIDNFTKKTPRIATLNEITNPEDKEDIKDDISTSVSNDSEVRQEDTKENKKTETVIPESKNEISIEQKTKSEVKEEIDWFGDNLNKSKTKEDDNETTWWKNRKELLNNSNKVDEINEKERKKFTIRKNNKE